MNGLRLPARLEAALWEKSRGLRGRLRHWLGKLARGRRRLAGDQVAEKREVPPAPLPAPLLAAGGAGWAAAPAAAGLENYLIVGGEGQGETGLQAAYVAVAGDPAALPAGALEALLLVAAVENLDLVEGGWAEPSATPGLGPSEIRPLAGGLWLRRRRGDAGPAPLLGKVVPLLGGEKASDDCRAESDPAWPFFRSFGPYRRQLPEAPAQLTYTTRLDLVLAALPPDPGPPTVLFLLPFLAVGGAERLLYDLLANWRGCRSLIVTTEPHQAALGQTVGSARALTPHVYTLGDWLPRESHAGVVFHLLRHYQVKTLVSWNGTTFFYDEVNEIRHLFPRLRILAQLYHHQGGFFSRSGPVARAVIDGHLAVNRAIARALQNELGESSDKVFLLHHGVELPAALPDEEVAARRRQRREELGLPAEALVIGTFIRLHPQKRPFDVLALARRFAARKGGQEIVFLLVGGGQLEAEIEAELAARPLPNLCRHPLVADARPFYEAIDLCLLTSEYEGLPIFLLDGLARGIPCVSTAVGEVPELLESGGGVCAAVGDLDAMAAAIETLGDPERRRQEGLRGRQRIAERFSLAAFAAAYRQAVFPGAPDDGG